MLFTEIPGDLFQHLPDGQIVGAAGFTGAAADAFGCLMGQGGIAFLGPFLQAVAVQVAFEQEAGRNADACSTGLAVIAAAAEVGA